MCAETPSSPEQTRAAWCAVVRYRPHDGPKHKIKALREGLEAIAVELVEDHGVELEKVEQWLEDAADEAGYAAEMMERDR